ncbi:MAG: IclR family transcriptional regulator [Desulfobacterota bacterium]|nr:IclR family transcriptional regulator [Thermodesulfobacteriota bacterium]
MKKTSYAAPSVQKAFKILQAIADSSSGLGVSELAKQLKIGKSTVHGITSALEALGVLVRNPVDKRFHVGYTLLELGRRAYGKIELREIARGPMERLMERVGETIFLGILNGDHITILDVVESPKELKITSPPGTRLPLLAGATGKAFLSQLDEKKAKEIVQKVGLTKFTPKSITEPKRFLREAQEARVKGYAIDDEEYLVGVRAVAAPIPLGPQGFAAIWAVGFTSSLDDQKMERVISEIRKTAEEIRRSIKS